MKEFNEWSPEQEVKQSPEPESIPPQLQTEQLKAELKQAIDNAEAYGADLKDRRLITNIEEKLKSLGGKEGEQKNERLTLSQRIAELQKRKAA